jgi:hypothetical protein
VSAEDVEERMTGLEANIKNLKPNLGAIEAGDSRNRSSGEWNIRKDWLNRSKYKYPLVI